MNNKIVLEIVWWLVTAIITYGVLYPIISTIDAYPFLISNAIVVAAFVTLVRYIFLLPYTFIYGKLYLKAGFILLSPIIIFLLVQEVLTFQTTVDEQGWEAILGISQLQKVQNLSNYIRSEFLFFGVGSVMSAFIFPARLVASIWQIINSAKGSLQEMKRDKNRG